MQKFILVLLLTTLFTYSYATNIVPNFTSTVPLISTTYVGDMATELLQSVIIDPILKLIDGNFKELTVREILYLLGMLLFFIVAIMWYRDLRKVK